MIYRVGYKRYLETAKSFMLVEDDIECADTQVNECGVLTFVKEDGGALMHIPPGFWVMCEPAPPDAAASNIARPAAANQSLIVQP